MPGYAHHMVPEAPRCCVPNQMEVGFRFVGPRECTPTRVYSMLEGALSSNGAEGLMKHGRASREAT